MDSRTDLIRRIYGFDWATVGSRCEGFAQLHQVVAPDFESRLSHEHGDRVLKGVEGLEMFVEALEQDFSEFHYDPDEIVEIGRDGVLVLGRIYAEGPRHRDAALRRIRSHLERPRRSRGAGRGPPRPQRGPDGGGRYLTWVGPLALVPEVAALGEDHGDACGVAGLDHLGVAL